MARYRKLHMFDVDVEGVSYRESEHERAGEEIVTASRSARPSSGLSICYDLRFPELYRILALRGADILTVPVGLHRGDRTGPLGGPAASEGDRERLLRPRFEPVRRRRRRTTTHSGTR